MSQAYDEYLNEHIANVQKAYNTLIGFIPDLPEKLGLDLPVMFSQHDESKWKPEEYYAYNKYFYGKAAGRSHMAIENFKYAWLHHIHNNPHHWQYWVLQNDDEGEEALEMPALYVVEMICDWWSFSYAKGDMTEIFPWYEAHKEKMKLHPKTRKLVEDILGKIRAAYEIKDEEVKERADNE